VLLRMTQVFRARRRRNAIADRRIGRRRLSRSSRRGWSW
jgi:hypothetical protein